MEIFSRLYLNMTKSTIKNMMMIAMMMKHLDAEETLFQKLLEVL